MAMTPQDFEPPYDIFEKTASSASFLKAGSKSHEILCTHF
jgi:hypothetical protein